MFTTDCSPERPKIKNTAILSGLCIGVSDGDTFTILTEKKKEYKIRLLHVNCPEKGQPFGKNAKQFTADFCFKRQVKIHYNPKKSTDRNGRVLGVAYNDGGEELNIKLVEAGLAWHFKRYSKEERYGQAEVVAREAGLGLWADKGAITPWEWRKIN